MAPFSSQIANDNCVVNQQLFPINAAQFALGRYNLFAEYTDGASSVLLTNYLIGTSDVR
ncbi:hypothetical protein ACLESO_03205 [Pyxidicoccus sp. 3LG]